MAEHIFPPGAAVSFMARAIPVEETPLPAGCQRWMPASVCGTVVPRTFIRPLSNLAEDVRETTLTAGLKFGVNFQGAPMLGHIITIEGSPDLAASVYGMGSSIDPDEGGLKWWHWALLGALAVGLVAGGMVLENKYDRGEFGRSRRRRRRR